ncbi:MAG: hypothetical protein APG12_00560 [Candidatus Methanofastidiosum methylothiophilum]|uniref:Uncharacterized protein n=1 Tax=Candidatus Methanofastidiosum methylothiophilum TaxID=1705564 RepID=A0A150ITR3_9EURY|nr:MAG: hypothetical protein APG10_00483 [Candidatus Methanofastidiosum methylthiophilus]KYC48377.1 MAG: hypothetical protein APG11_00390 [Candidatus Methanofastidiosum methylthiophilus]KYC50758.1 MAG: hypothetical protein APG12_00560 [Candidatus Methanofastidiosum methylthiophilus]
MRKLFGVIIAIIFASSIFLTPVSAAQNTPPTLEGGVLWYTFKGSTFSYKFQVTYNDAEGDLPVYMFVYINGSRRIMEKQDVTDNNAKDGIVYILALSDEDLFKLAPNAREWEIEYWFRTNDGHGPVSTKNSNLFALDYVAMGLTPSNTAGASSCSKASS